MKNMRWLCLCLIAAISACGTPARKHVLLAEDTQVTVVLSGSHDTWSSLAETYYSNKSLGWYIADRNSLKELTAGQKLVIPKSMEPHYGIFDNYEQIVPILTYHNFGPKKSNTMIRPQDFEQQLRYLRDNNYRVISLSALSKHMQQGLPIPHRAVVITIDDGFRSTYDIAFPLLKKYGMPATVFVYSDFINNGGLKKKQLIDMLESDLIDIHSHSKTHRNFNMPLANESLKDFYQNLKLEIIAPQEKLNRLLSAPEEQYFAYPYGEVNPKVVEFLTESNHKLGFTVSPGSISSYSYPYTLRRFQVFGNRNLKSFIKIIKRNRRDLAI